MRREASLLWGWAGCVMMTMMVWSMGNAAYAQAYGIDTRVSNNTLLIDTLTGATPGSLTIEPAFPLLGFDEPLGLFEIPDGSGRLVVMQRDGLIQVFPKSDPTPGNMSTFLDLRDRVNDSRGELGCLGMAFDPDYATNGRVYVYYTTLEDIAEWPFYDADSVIARYTNDVPADDSVDRSTEDILLIQQQPYDNHNGGSIAFGPDGMLYIAFGDGGDYTSQQLDSLLGKILRIDVTTPPANPGVLNYVIPPDNPFVGVSGAREETYANGLRNPFRMAFDPLTGVLYAGDVGEDSWEEINVIRSGENYGWPIMEGPDCFNPPTGCDTTGLTLPIASHVNGIGEEAVAILGGHVYYGDAIPELYGTYIYADFITSNIWGLTYDGTEVTSTSIVKNDSFGMRSLAQDASGEVYFLDCCGIFVLRKATKGGGGNALPTQLSDMPALLAAGLGQDQTTQGILPYRPSSELWSDNARKSRFIALPGLSQATYQAETGWDFPEGTVLIKNFSLPLDFRDPDNTAQRIETRLFVKNSNTWHGFSYEWNEAETDAVLLPGSKTRDFNLIDDDGNPLAYSWYYPSQSDCFVCHSTAANTVLGLNTAQLNHDFAYPDSGVTDNQLRTLDHITFFDSALPDTPDNLPSSPDAFDDPGASVAERAQSYLNANCAMCHRPGGPTNVSMDLRWGIPLENRQIVDVTVTGNDLGISNPVRFALGEPERSLLVQRMDRRDAHQMPPLGTGLVHDEAVALVTQWILEGGDVGTLAVSAASPTYALHEQDDTAVFAVAATGTGTLTYQWYRDEPGPGGVTLLSGETNDTLVLSALSLADSAFYYCEVSDDSGTEQSPFFQLDVVVELPLGNLASKFLLAMFLVALFWHRSKKARLL